MVLSGIATTASAQEKSLRETLEQLSEDAARKYVAPISSAFGSDLNAGWFHRAPRPKKLGIDLEVGLVGMGSFFPSDSKSFKTRGRFRFSQAEARLLVGNQGFPPAVEDALVSQITSQNFELEISGATVIGSTTDYITIGFLERTFDVSGVSYTVPSQSVALPVAGFGELADVDFLPLAAPQLSVGTVFGTQATFRYLPSVRINDDLGSFKYFGFGVQHNPSVWLPNPLPVDLAASFFSQSLEIGTLFKTTTTSFGVTASKRLGWGLLNLTPYAGAMLESATMEVSYDFKVDTPTGVVVERVNFDLEGENKSRIVLGLGFRLLIFNVNADYNIGKYNSVSAGLNFII